MSSAIDDIATHHPGKRVLAVTHAGTINAYLAHVLGLDADFFFPAANASLSVVRLHEGQRLLISLNDVAHLGGLSDTRD